ncbi:hypothetical protein L208DRAFT_1314989 [Tricholoma matsutake]|nr:hypothetical protein L208DRAFT_1314989 [Tricholoma matsutake 945]
MLKSVSQPEGRSSSLSRSQNTLQSAHARPSSIPPHNRMASEPRFTKESVTESGLDLTGLLERSGLSVVKTRSGSVLSRGFILKTDYYPSGRALDLELNIYGAPNFRAPRQGAFNVFGAAQPRSQGLKAILSILRCRPGTPNPAHVVWFSTREEPIVYISGRPFVLRDASEPRRTLSLSDRAENLEAIENRLKNDILQEATRQVRILWFGGLVLTHNEVGPGNGEGAILPTWTSVDNRNVKTSRELWEAMKSQGWNVDYHRIPISPDRPIEDNYLDAYVQVIRATDPLRTALVFSCGMGAVRTTFAMVAASLVRRKQVITRGIPDPYALKVPPIASTPVIHGSGTNTVSRETVTMSHTESLLMHALEQATAQQDLNKSLLKLTYLLQLSLQNKNSQSAIELLMSHPALLDNLRKAHMGNYGVILSLLGCLDRGLQAKKLVDRVIDSTDQVTNLREDILIYRIKYSLTSMEEAQGENFLKKAVKAMEKYFFMIAFASYVDDSSEDFSQSFSSWLKARTEIWNQIMFLRKSYGSRLNVFSPINDLSLLSKSGFENRSLEPGKKNDVAIAGGQILGDEYSDHVVKNRSGIILRESTLLKSDQWLRESHHVEQAVRGAINFRQVPNTNIYALGQPSLEAIDEVVARIKDAHPSVVWINLREEPVVYINGAPYCLRREGFSLRNMKDYGGISASRLEVLEERLRDDVISEVNAFGGRLLLHTETADGTVVPVWEEVIEENVLVLKDIMEARRDAKGVNLHYTRVPITAEKPPDFADLSDLIDVVMRTSISTPIVVNCQLGRGRSTLASIILLLIRKWLDLHRLVPTPTTPRYDKRSFLLIANLAPMEPTPVKARHSYQVINNLLRVIRKGPAVKDIVDDAVDRCSTVFNLRDSIEESRNCAEQATDEKQKRIHAQKGLQNLRRYFELIVFQSYLQSTEPDTMESFESVETYVKNRPVIKTFERELLAEGIDALKPLERADAREGMAHPDEVTRVVVNRSGSILSASTILKSDFFSNLQKMALPERIEGSPNFRRVPLTLKPVLSRSSSPSEGEEFVEYLDDGKMVCGSGMPTVEGLKRALQRVDAGPGGRNTVYWTSLREEPVIYVAGRPHVLRLVDRPLENVEATGITTAVVESMEQNFKKDVLCELIVGGGRILLHDEIEERPGVFSIIPLWETVSEGDILTPRDVMDLVAKEGYKINYGRTDEQAPLPDALSQLLERVKTGMSQAGDFIFNCQMGRGRTTTGMITACLISSTMAQNWDNDEQENAAKRYEPAIEIYDTMDGPSEEEAYLKGMSFHQYKTILQLVGVLSHGKVAKRLTDRAIDLMQDVQNLRKAIYDYKLKVDACEKGSNKQRKLHNITVNYLYRYGTLIVFANYLIEMREKEGPQAIFPEWLLEHREITKLLQRRSLD